MRSVSNSKNFDELSPALSGSNGLVYLMFLGRETYAAEIHLSLVGTIYNHSANVNQAVKRLLKHESEFLVFVKRHRKEGIQGSEARIYTASFDPIFITLEKYGIKFDKEELRFAISSLSEANDAFIKYLCNVYQKSIVMNLPWNFILSDYFSYLSEILRSKLTNLFVPPMPSDVPVSSESVSTVISKYPDMRRTLFSIAFQLASPSLRLNPEFKARLAETLSGVDAFESDMRNLLFFFNELKDMGINNTSDLESLAENLKLRLDLESLVENLKLVLEKMEKLKGAQPKEEGSG